MKPLLRGRSARFFTLFLAVLILVAFASSSRASTVEGTVYDNGRNPLYEIDVELRNENGQTRRRTRTDGIGRYSFSSLADGRYYIKVFAFRHNLADQEQMIKVESLSILGGIGNHTYQLDFHLVPKRGGLGDTTTGVIFVQDVPGKAKDYYRQAIKLFENDDRDEGFKILIKAVETYPTYYDALNKLGMHMLFKKRYLDAAAMFVRAVEVNPKSSKSFHYMGIAFSSLGKDYYKAALIAHGKAEILARNAYQIPFEIGKIHKELGNFAEAELKLIRAKKLAPTKIPEIHLQLAELYGNDLKKYGKAADELELYLRAANRKNDKKIRKQITNLRKKAEKQS